MSHVDSHANGAFCWLELATTDQEAAKKFYSALFGWNPVDFPMGPDGVYTMFQLEGRNAGAGYTMGKEDRERGIPPHWMLYVQTGDIQETAGRVSGLGGTVLAGPFDVMTFGKMAVIQDPTGAIFALWQPLSHPGFGIKDQAGTLCWADLMTPDNAKAKAFYEGLLGWKFEAGQDQSGYLHLKNGEQFIGGMPPSQYMPPGAPAHWTPYVLVAGCDQSVAKVKELGGKLCMGPMDIPNAGRFAVVMDPQGASFSLFEPKMG